MKLNNKGFSALEGLLVFIVIALLAGVGWYVWDQNKKEDAKSSTSNITSFAECKAAGNPIAESYPEQCSAGGKTYTNPDQKVEEPQKKTYLEVPELGVKIKLTAEIEGLYYDHEKENPTAAYLSIESLRGTDCSAEDTSPSALVKVSESETKPGAFYARVPSIGKKIGSHYYFFEGSQSACQQDVNSATQKRATELRSYLGTHSKELIEAL
jgi:hypothetical protein